MAQPSLSDSRLASQIRFLPPLILSALLCACAVPSPKAPATATLATLADTQWRVAMVNNGKQAVSSVLTGSTLTLAFDDAGRASGSSGCNRFSASFVETGNSLHFGQAAGTRMMCVQPEGVMEQEAQMLAALGTIGRWRLEDGRLVLRTEAEAMALVLERVATPGGTTNAPNATGQPPLAASLFGAEWVVEDIDGGGVIDSSRATLTFAPDGSVYGRSSCNTYRGRYTITGDAIAVSQLAGTMMSCAPSLMLQEQRFNAALTQAQRIVFNAEGALLLLAGEQRRILARR